MFRALPFFMLSVLLLAAPAHAGDEAADPSLPAVQYIYFEPALVVNFGSSGRMRYLRTEIAIKVSSTTAAGKVSQHKPYLRNTLVFMLSAQEPEMMNSSQGRESLRRLALEEVRRTMSKLEGSPFIDDLFFNTFVVQN